MLEILKAILFGIVEGITEWLPISSTGHMILLNECLHLNVSDSFYEMFQVVIQLGAIAAVVVLYFHTLNPFSRTKTPVQRLHTWRLWLLVVIGVLPAAIIGIPLDDWFDEHLYNHITVAVTLILYGAAFIIIERRRAGQAPRISGINRFTVKTALGIGGFQALSIIPGTSRSGSTILGAMLLGVDRTAAAEFSFFMAIPTMLGASALKICKFLLRGYTITGLEWAILLVGCAVAFGVSLAVIRGLVGYVRRHSFSAFGVYRIVLGLLVLGFGSIA